MGKVHNPDGDGVPAVSTAVSAARRKHAQRQNNEPDPEEAPRHHATNDHETQVKEEGSARRNITRKTNNGVDVGKYDAARKRMGGAGKGKWTQAMDGSDTLPITNLDVNDPLYDEETLEGAVLVSAQSNNEDDGVANGTKVYDPVADRIVYGPKFTRAEFKIRVTDALEEYFDSGDADEFIACITELKSAEYHAELIKKAISLSLDKNSREKELISRLLSRLHPIILTDNDVSNGFQVLLDSLPDLCIDAPDAKTIVATFLARAVIDEVLPPAFLSSRSGEVTEAAVRLLSMEHCGTRLEHAWGPGDGRPVGEIKISMDQLLKEYLLSRELDEAARCIRELNCAHFHHELVKRGVTAAMEELHDKSDSNCVGINIDDLDAVAALYAFLVENSIVSESQLRKGMKRLNDAVDDLKLDVTPNAPALLIEFQRLLSAHGVNIEKA
eukprot:CAMPEP_0172424994 /NCGR_PEP_ID=MMETSP1064-20121228/29323_1 /TAXON_ID=202472 /ORGANISM="Aulacoseira subarctica , Strain CCAP 1002/5" /LENGTH=441 /DNA_ID=CAMNT_0013167509 /DNA_START=208 /DNA_END=1533 /DNA_ORIENTATION=-